MAESRFARFGPLLAYVGGLAAPAPRTVRFALTEGVRALRKGDGEWPVCPPTPAVLAQAALDELLIAAMKTPGRYPNELADYERAGAELRAAHELYESLGVLDDPKRFHPDPPPLDEAPLVRVRRPGADFEHLIFESRYAPHPMDPATERWLSRERNRTAHAWVVRHSEPGRPWLVCLHAFGMGNPWVDLWAFRAAWLRHALGLNVIMPVLPLHGPRRIGLMSGTAFMGYNLLDIGHGLAQSVWDVRRVLSWVRAQDAPSIGVYGVSLGSHVASLVAGLDPDLALVLCGIPTADFADLFSRHGPPRMLRIAQEHGLMGDEALGLHRLVTPMSFAPVVPKERLEIYAGLGDRMATPAQAHKLWEHWDRPRIGWFASNHIAFLWSREIAAFVRTALTDAGLAA